MEKYGKSCFKHWLSRVVAMAVTVMAAPRNSRWKRGWLAQGSWQTLDGFEIIYGRLPEIPWSSGKYICVKLIL